MNNGISKYYASVLTEDGLVAPAPLTRFDQVEAVDVGLTRVATVSDGQIIANPRFLKKASKNLRRKQKQLSRKTKGSANHTQARLLVAKAHERVANARKDFHHQQSIRLARENQAVIVEDLAVKNMLKNHCLAKAISDAGWGQFNRFLDYKLTRQGRRLVRVDRFYPSSKTCHVCRHQVDELPLSVREWECPVCATRLDRDGNATQNLKQQGILQLKAEGCTVSACGGLGKTRDTRAPAVEAGSPSLQ